MAWNSVNSQDFSLSLLLRKQGRRKGLWSNPKSSGLVTGQHSGDVSTNESETLLQLSINCT